MTNPLQTMLLGMHCDAVEFCPIPEYTNLVAVGMYELDEVTRHRAGRIQLYIIDTAAVEVDSYMTSRASHETAGVFDFKWFPCLRSGQAIAAAALADDTLAILQVRSLDIFRELDLHLYLEKVFTCGILIEMFTQHPPRSVIHPV